MSLSSLCQVILLSLFILADSYLFALDLFDGRDHHRIPLGLPSPFELYPGMFDPTVLPIIHKDNIRNRPYRPPFTSEITTSRIAPKEKFDKVITTEGPPPTTDETEEDMSTQDPDIEREVFLMKNAKVPEVTNSPIEDEKRELPEANSLSIHDDPKVSVKWFETTTPNQDLIEAENASNVFSESEQEKNGTDDSELNKNSDYVLIPVTAVNPAVLNLAPNSNTVATVAGESNIGLRDQNSSPAFISLDNNVNAIPSNQPNYINVPLNSNDGASNNVYTIVTVPNNQNQPNNFYVQPNSPQVYNFVPLNNLPTGNYQPNTYAIINNQLVPINNQPINIVPINNQPNNFVSINSQPNSFVDMNNQPNNFVPVNTQPNSFVPVNNQPINLVPVNNQPNFLPINNQPNNLVSANNQPNTFVPLNNQPINIIPINNIPNNYIPVNNNNLPNSYGSTNNNFVPVNNIPSNVVTLNNQPNNFVPANLVPINNIPSNNQPINNGITFGSLPDDKSNTANNYVPNNVVSLTPVGTVSYTRDQDDDESDKKDIKIKNERDDE